MYSEGSFLNDPAYKNYLLETGLLIKLYNTIPLSKINPDDYSAVHFAGGFASLTDFPSDENLKSVTRDIYEKEGSNTWFTEDPQRFLGDEYSINDYEQVKD
ncbi:MAG: hypothetical protein ACPGYI_03785, partial [Flavobacteriaceae bacterium]